MSKQPCGMGCDCENCLWAVMQRIEGALIRLSPAGQSSILERLAARGASLEK